MLLNYELVKQLFDMRAGKLRRAFVYEPTNANGNSLSRIICTYCAKLLGARQKYRLYSIDEIQLVHEDFIHAHCLSDLITDIHYMVDVRIIPRFDPETYALLESLERPTIEYIY